MKIGILGTGHVARLLASAWANAGHEITLGSRDPGAKRLDFPVKTLLQTASTTNSSHRSRRFPITNKGATNDK